MTNIESYKQIFLESLSIDIKKFNEEIKYNEVEEWDSIGHMTLISGLEEGFNISLETDDIVEFSSYKKGIEILKKYKITF
jgi:acyl carrier protein|tara:strand:- start:16 stop:255 length:240 start_codon:yes stop_codon:yes gene_type:complete